MDERLRFVARLLEGEKMAVLCREFDISRKTGYKIYSRYQECGLQGLTDRSRRPYRHANKLPFQIEREILKIKRDKPSWGAPKIREKLRRLESSIPMPAISTVHAVLDRHGLVKRRKRRGYKAQGTALSIPQHPNALWCADYKGEFMLADKRYCYPLTSPTSRPVTSSAAKPSRAPKSSSPSPYSSAPLRISACRSRSAPTTACPSPARTHSSA